MATQQPSGAQQMFGDFAPSLVTYTDDVLFGDVWKDPALPPRDRSLVTVACLVTYGNTDQLLYHLGNAKDKRRHRRRADRGDHPPGVLRRLAKSHGRDQERVPRRRLNPSPVQPHRRKKLC